MDDTREGRDLIEGFLGDFIVDEKVMVNMDLINISQILHYFGFLQKIPAIGHGVQGVGENEPPRMNVSVAVFLR